MEKIKNSNISDSEMKVMEKIWKSKRMVTVSEIAAALNEDGEEWTYKTVATFMLRLQEKGYISSTKSQNRLSYFPLIDRRNYNRREAENFVKRRFDGSLRNFLSSFADSNDMDIKELNELKEWLEKKKD